MVQGKIEDLSVSINDSDYSMVEIAIEDKRGNLTYPQAYRVIHGETPILVLMALPSGVAPQEPDIRDRKARESGAEDY